MNEKRTIVVGDIHGCLDELLNLMEVVEWQPESDRLILAGDLVDRGPDSVGVVRWARENNIEIVRGNHDHKYVKMHHRYGKWKNQGIKSDSHYQYRDPSMVIYDDLSKEDIEFLVKSPAYIKLDKLNTIVVHAGLWPDVSFDSQEPEDMMHVRFLYESQNGYSTAPLNRKANFAKAKNSIFWAERYYGTQDIVYGHHVWDTNDIMVHENHNGARCYGIDTGAVFGGKLTALILREGIAPEIRQVQSTVKSSRKKEK